MMVGKEEPKLVGKNMPLPELVWAGRKKYQETTHSTKWTAVWSGRISMLCVKVEAAFIFLSKLSITVKVVAEFSFH